MKTVVRTWLYTAICGLEDTFVADLWLFRPSRMAFHALEGSKTRFMLKSEPSLIIHENTLPAEQYAKS